ncbi:MAG: hypothetical protein ACRECH_18465, partial [Nitrososphaerales archaeon]
LMLYTSSPGKFTQKYVRWGEKQPVLIKRGTRKGETVIGYHNLESNSNRDPWYALSDAILPSHLLLIRFIDVRHFDLLSEQEILTDQTACLLYPFRSDGTRGPDLSDYIPFWVYANSIIFLISKELYGMRMGGAALQLYTKAFTDMPVFDLSKFRVPPNFNYAQIVDVKKIQDEMASRSRMDFDLEVLKLMGISNPEQLLPKLYEAMSFIVDDRLVKGKRYAQRMTSETNEESSDYEN